MINMRKRNLLKFLIAFSLNFDDIERIKTIIHNSFLSHSCLFINKRQTTTILFITFFFVR